ncbi:MAG: glucosaminidase domain-containing protein [Treponema sp.]|nr:glucosaminidase domain-containing protein [Treponema sp.]
MRVFYTAIAAVFILASCAALPPQKEVIPEFPQPPEHIMGKGTVPEEQLAAFLLDTNAGADGDFVRQLSAYYVEEAAAEGINHDTAFAQMCLETGFLRYGGLVTPDMNNFCGLGAIGPEQPGLVFPDARSGVRAHIQHLQAYASVEPLNQDLIDPRYRYVKRGSSPTIHGLAGTWAADRAYSGKIGAILQRLYEFAH